ncbi:unannotated protein [freshwater metagenome]|uniref:Unannotated protein n=1 Tax=freshwater metagenome TaxID=449393 RepID=A0A6J6MVC5_9ZZZZ
MGPQDNLEGVLVSTVLNFERVTVCPLYGPTNASPLAQGFSYQFQRLSEAVSYCLNPSLSAVSLLEVDD